MKNKKPETQSEWALERASLSCRVGIDQLHAADGYYIDQALYSMFGAMESIIEYLKIKERESNG